MCANKNIKKSLGFFKNVINNVYKSYIQYMNKKNLALNNPQWWICHKTKSFLSNIYIYIYIYICIYMAEWLNLGLVFESARFRSQLQESSPSSHTDEF